MDLAYGLRCLEPWALPSVLHKLGMLVCACHPNTQDLESGGKVPTLVSWKMTLALDVCFCTAENRSQSGSHITTPILLSFVLLVSYLVS